MPEKRKLIDRTKDTWNTATEKMGEAKEKTLGTIKEHPFTSIIIAAAVGAIAGATASELIRRIRRKERKSIMKHLRKMF